MSWILQNERRTLFYVGAAAVIALIVIVGILSGRKVKNGSFSGSKNGGAAIVAGALIGTLYGGSSTIGTAQLAFSKGFSAWWYTLGGGIGLLLLALVFASPIYKKKDVKTIPDIIAKEYGPLSGVLIAVLSSIGTFLSFVAQIISGCALMMSVFGISFNLSVAIVAALIIVYVLFGGAQALGRAGIVKTLIIAVSVLVCGAFALFFADGLTIAENLDMFPKDEYFNLFARGFVKDVGSGLSLVLGVVTTQTYISAILMAKNITESKAGAYASAIIIPLLGIPSIFVGMYMKANVTDAAFDAKQALPAFIIQNMPPLVAGIMIAALLIAVVGTGSGLALGMSSMMFKNIIKPIADKKSRKLSETLVTRLSILAVTAIGAGICFLNLGNLILDWSFLSMGLRAAVGFLPLLGALFMPDKIDRRAVIVSMPCAVLFTILGNSWLPSNFDPLFVGLGASFIVLSVGYFIRLRKKKICK